MPKNKKGFTLVEMVVVIVIISILAAMAIPSLSGYKREAEDAVALSNVKLIQRCTEAMLAKVQDPPDQVVIPHSGPGEGPPILVEMERLLIEYIGEGLKGKYTVLIQKELTSPHPVSARMIIVYAPGGKNTYPQYTYDAYAEEMTRKDKA